MVGAPRFFGRMICLTVACLASGPFSWQPVSFCDVMLRFASRCHTAFLGAMSRFATTHSALPLLFFGLVCPIGGFRLKVAYALAMGKSFGKNGAKRANRNRMSALSEGRK